MEEDEGGLRQLADRALRSAARVVRTLRVPTPSHLVLARARERAARAVLARVGREVDALAPEGTAGNERLAEIAERALRDMREDVRRRARSSGALATLAAEIDARWSDTDETEHLDDPSYPHEDRVRIIENLDHVNRLFGNYESFFETLEPFLRADGPTRVLDLAAGHGGFALECARIARARGVALSMVASDLKDEYLEVGRVIAEKEGLDVEFRVQDALDLRDVEPGEFDVVLSTQSLHHFPIGLVASLAAEAARTATRGVLLLDGARSRANGAIVPLLGVARFGDAGFAHDAFVSLRRFFVPEELGLLAHLGARAAGLGEAHVESSWIPPGHCMARITRR